MALISYIFKEDHMVEPHQEPQDTDTLGGWLGCDSFLGFRGSDSHGSFSFLVFASSLGLGLKYEDTKEK